MDRKNTNTILLGVNACLVTALLIGWLGGGFSGPQAAEAVPPDKSRAGSGIPNAGAQRQEMIKRIDALTVAVNQLRQQVQTGVRVEVTNASDLARAMGQ